MTISVVIPSFNHARFIRATLDSVLEQDGVAVEVLVFDGGSQDGTVEILKSYGDKINWVSNKDRGQTDAINQGLRKATGDVLAYLNSDDIYLPGALAKVDKYFRDHPAAQVVYGDAWHLREDGSVMERYPSEPWDYQRLGQTCFICQPATFWRREVMERFGHFDERRDWCMDYEYWLRVGRTLPFHFLEGEYLAGSRLHEDTKTLRMRYPVHRQILDTVLQYANSVPYEWLHHLANAKVHHERSAGADERPATDHGAMLADMVLSLAGEYRIPLTPAFLDELKRRCAL